MRPGGVKIDGFELLFIYNGGEYSDPFELATITVNDDISYTFQVDSEDWGTWSGSGGFSNCGPTTDSGTGCFRFSNPFGNLAVTSIKFQATSVTPRPLFANDSDYSLGELSYSASATSRESVPEPASLFLLGSGLVGMALARRRARAKNS